MRLRIILASIAIVFITVTTVILAANRTASQAINNFVFRGGLSGTEELVKSLENHYRDAGSWQGIEPLFKEHQATNPENPIHSGTPNPQGQPRGQGQGQGQGLGLGQSQRLRLADAEGNIVYDSSGLPIPTTALTADALTNAIQLKNRGEIVGYLIPEFEFADRFRATFETLLVARINSAAITAGLIGGVVSLVIALGFAYYLNRPIQALTNAARQLAEGDLAHRVDVQGKDEMATLGHTFNQMATSLQTAEKRRRALTADIAHELRNPLAVQRANLEAMLDGIYELSPENIAPILEQNRFLEHLVSDLRTLALADEGELNLYKTETDFSALVDRVSQQFVAQATQKNITLHTNIPADCRPLTLDSARITQILTNLYSNALHHSPKGGEIRIDVRCEPTHIVLNVHDSGPGIPVETLPYIFDRFYRADKARTRDKGSTGLGLTIARKLAEAHDGTLTAANHPAGGAVFTLDLPV